MRQNHQWNARNYRRKGLIQYQDWDTDASPEFISPNLKMHQSQETRISWWTKTYQKTDLSKLPPIQAALKEDDKCMTELSACSIKFNDITALRLKIYSAIRLSGEKINFNSKFIDGAFGSSRDNAEKLTIDGGEGGASIEIGTLILLLNALPNLQEIVLTNIDCGCYRIDSVKNNEERQLPKLDRLSKLVIEDTSAIACLPFKRAQTSRTWNWMWSSSRIVSSKILATWRHW